MSVGYEFAAGTPQVAYSVDQSPRVLPRRGKTNGGGGPYRMEPMPSRPGRRVGNGKPALVSGA
jgi:hypothetical protein